MNEASLNRSPTSSLHSALVPFALAGLSLFGFVLDEIDVPHDNLEGVVTLSAGALVGLVAGAVARRASEALRFSRVKAIAWDVVRYVLAFEMVRYGLAKVVGMQFYPQYWTLDRRVVDLHPMSLVWAFFGRSYGYQLAGGIIELGSAVLLCFRRTTLVGACLLATALANVVLVNVFYDVYVKLFASLYLLLDASLIARDAPRLWAAFFPAVERATGAERGRVLRGILVALVLGVPSAEILRSAVRHGVFHRDDLEGAWIVENRAGLDDLFPSDPGPWDEVYFEKWEGAGSIRIGKKRVHFEATIDERVHTMTLAKWGRNPSPPLAGTFELHGEDLRFAGDRGGAPFALTMKRDYPR